MTENTTVTDEEAALNPDVARLVDQASDLLATNTVIRCKLQQASHLIDEAREAVNGLMKTHGIFAKDRADADQTIEMLAEAIDPVLKHLSSHVYFTATDGGRALRALEQRKQHAMGDLMPALDDSDHEARSAAWAPYRARFVARSNALYAKYGLGVNE